MLALSLIALILLTPIQQDQSGGFPKVRLSGTYTILWRQFADDFLQTDPDASENGWDAHNRLTLNIGVDRWQAGIQADLDRFDKDEGRSNIEKRYLIYENKGVKATGGDFYASFGRGTTLSILKTHESYGIENQFDDTIDGGRFSYHEKNFSFDVLAGRVERMHGTYEDDLSGASFEFTPASWLRLGASAVRTDFELYDGATTTAGTQATLTLLDGSLVLAHEYAGVEADFTFDNGSDNGRLSYFELAAQWLDFTLTAEFKDAENFFSEYSTPPLIEEQSFELFTDFFAIHHEDLEALKVRGDYLLPNGTLVHGTVATYSETAKRHPTYFRYDRDITHYYGGLEHSFASGAFASIVFGRRAEESTGYFREFSGRTLHGSADVSIPLSNSFAINGDYHFARFSGDLVDFERNKLSIGLARSQLFTFSWIWESSNLPGELFFSKRENYYSVQADLKLLGRHIIRVSYGNNRGSLKCSGGVCRYIPAFDGLRLEGVLRF